jgi:acyl-CoA thioesterase
MSQTGEKTAPVEDPGAFADLLNEKDPFPRTLGMRFTRVAPGRAEVELAVREEMLNFLGVTHGGVVFALADAAFGAASNAHGGTAMAIHAAIDYIRATGAGTVLTARAEEESRTGRLARYRVAVEDGEGRLVALFHGIAYLKK